MHIQSLPDKTQDYLKTVWFIRERHGGSATLSEVAEQMGQKLSTASEAMKRLVERGLVNHERYAGITLTAQGERLAVAMVRRHRLLEMFLCQTLGYTWDEVHDEAEVLEHAITDTLLERIDAHLGHPTRDPHGDPIPDADGAFETISAEDLTVLELGEQAVVERILDRDAQLLRYLAKHGIVPGATITVVDAPYPGMRTVQAAGCEPASLAETSFTAINIRR